MFAEYKRDVSHNYLILHGDETINTTSYQVRILTGNTMSSILKCRMQGLDGTWLFYYDITSKQSLASFYEQRKLQGEDLEMILKGFLHVNRRNGRVSSEYGTAGALPGIYFSGCGEKRGFVLLSAGLSSSGAGTVSGTDRIFVAQT